MISGEMPYRQYADNNCALFAVLHAIERGERPGEPTLDNAEKEYLWEICHACWETDPAKRLQAADAIKRIGDLRAQIGLVTVRSFFFSPIDAGASHKKCKP